MGELDRSSGSQRGLGTLHRCQPSHRTLAWMGIGVHKYPPRCSSCSSDLANRWIVQARDSRSCLHNRACPARSRLRFGSGQTGSRPARCTCLRLPGPRCNTLCRSDTLQCIDRRCRPDLHTCCCSGTSLYRTRTDYTGLIHLRCNISCLARNRCRCRNAQNRTVHPPDRSLRWE